MILKYIVKDEENIKQVLREKLHISNNFFSKIKKRIYINDTLANHYDSIKCGDEIKVDLDFEEYSDNIVPNKKIKFDILYEDEWILIVNKSKNMPVHPSINHYDNSLSNGIKYYYDLNNIHKKIRIVNRLDKDTTGIVMFAKSEYIQDNLKNYDKEYLAICEGIIEGCGTINKPIARKEESIIERCISDRGQNAVTHYESLTHIQYNKKQYTLLKCRLETGRTHQIRLHLSSINHPILGDTLYGIKDKMIKSQMLHAYKIIFIHPVSKQKIDIIAPIPSEMNEIINIKNKKLLIK